MSDLVLCPVREDLSAQSRPCCYAAGHSGDHLFSNRDESDRIRWKLAADARDAAVARIATLEAELADARRRIEELEQGALESIECSTRPFEETP